MHNSCHRINLLATVLCTTAILISFLVNGSFLHAGSGPVLSLSDEDLVPDLSRINLADNTTALTTENNTESSLQGTKKSPTAAALLGGLLGFGSGQYYSKRRISGTSFLVIDGIFWAVFAAGAVGVYADDNDDSFAEELGEGIVGAGAMATGIAGLVVSHTAQAIWGPIAVNKYNEEREQTSQTWQPFVAPTQHSALFGLTYRF